MIRGVHHLSFSTRNLDGMLGFYGDLLGFERISDVSIADNTLFDHVVGLPGSRARGVMVQGGNIFLEFWQYETPVGKDPIANRPACDAGLTHVCFDVEDAILMHKTLSAAGVPFESEPQHLGSVITSYCRDPDGNLVELRQGIPGISKVELAPAVARAAQATLGN